MSREDGSRKKRREKGQIQKGTEAEVRARASSDVDGMWLLWQRTKMDQQEGYSGRPAPAWSAALPQLIMGTQQRQGPTFTLPTTAGT